MRVFKWTKMSIEKKHEKLVKEYEKLKADLETKENEHKNNQDRSKEIRVYVDTFRKSNKINAFSNELFAMLVDKVVVYNNEIKIRLKDGR